MGGAGRETNHHHVLGVEVWSTVSWDTALPAVEGVVTSVGC